MSSHDTSLEKEEAIRQPTQSAISTSTSKTDATNDSSSSDASKDVPSGACHTMLHYELDDGRKIDMPELTALKKKLAALREENGTVDRMKRWQFYEVAPMVQRALGELELSLEVTETEEKRQRAGRGARMVGKDDGVVEGDRENDESVVDDDCN